MSSLVALQSYFPNESYTPSRKRSIPQCSNNVPAIHLGKNAAICGPIKNSTVVHAATAREDALPLPPDL